MLQKMDTLLENLEKVQQDSEQEITTFIAKVQPEPIYRDPEHVQPIHKFSRCPNKTKEWELFHLCLMRLLRQEMSASHRYQKMHVADDS